MDADLRLQFEVLFLSQTTVPLLVNTDADHGRLWWWERERLLPTARASGWAADPRFLLGVIWVTPFFSDPSVSVSELLPQRAVFLALAWWQTPELGASKVRRMAELLHSLINWSSIICFLSSRNSTLFMFWFSSSAINLFLVFLQSFQWDSGRVKECVQSSLLRDQLQHVVHNQNL